MQSAKKPHTVAPVVETYSGQIVSLVDPDPNTISVIDIATHLSRQCRYNGATRFAWSVASHSLLCSDLAAHWPGTSKQLALHVLIHDAHEAYTGDIITPVKHIPQIRDAIAAIEAKLQRAIEKRFGITPPTADDQAFIKMIDDRALAIEAHHLVASRGKSWNLPKIIERESELFDDPGSEHDTRRHFIHRFMDLTESLARKDKTFTTAQRIGDAA